MIIILLAYYGPNAELLGNIKLAIWQFQNPISDIGAYTFNVAVLLIVDLVSFMINGIVLRIFCKINVLKVIHGLQKRFWHVFWAAESFLLMVVRLKLFGSSFDIYNLDSSLVEFDFQNFFQSMLGAGYDMTFEFDWKDGRYVLNDTLRNMN